MKKVLLSSFACSPIKGSEEGRGWNWAIGLAQMGYTVHCLTNFEDKAEIVKEHQKLNLPNLHFEFVELPFSLDELLFNPSKKTIYLHYLLWKKTAASQAVKLHKKHNFDIAHHATYGSFQQGTCLYKLEDCKIIFGPVGGGQMALPIFKSYFGKSWRTERIRNQVSKYLVANSSSLRKTLKKAAHVIATNSETKELLDSTNLVEEGKSHLTEMYAIPKKYNDLEFIDRPSNKIFNIIWVGRLLPRKGLNLSLQALSFLPENFQYKLTIVGGGSMGDNLNDWINAYGLDSKKINNLGQIPFKQVAEEYRKADIMLFCSLRDTLGIQVMEAMAYSLPLVVLNISGVKNLVPENCAIKIDPTPGEGTARSIAAALLELQQNESLRKEKAINAHKHAMNSTWEKRIEVFTKKYYEN